MYRSPNTKNNKSKLNELQMVSELQWADHLEIINAAIINLI